MKSAIIATALALSVAGCAVKAASPINTHSTVKVVMKQGHGSGVHIGNGAFLTAAHVVKDAKSVTLESHDGRETVGEVLWASKEYDIALVRADGYEGVASRLFCDVLPVGSEVVATGNPAFDDFVTTWGKISAEPVAKGAHLESVYRVQIPIAPGSSGGPLFDERGNIVGINVAIGLLPVGMGGGAYGIAFTVPSSEICKLLAKA